MVRFSALVFIVLLLLGVSLPLAQESSVQPSKRTLYLRARDVLKTSLETGDSERADQAFNYLKSNAKEGAPLTRFEEYLINMELNHFAQGIDIYADLRRIMLDSTYKPELENRVAEKDPLAVYLYRDLYPFTLQKADSLSARVDSSDVSDEYKKLYRVLLYSEIAIVWMSDNFFGRTIHWKQVNDTTSAGLLLDYGKKFVDTYPVSPYARVLDEQTLPYVEKVMKPLRDFRVDPFKHKYYTGGLGLYLYKWLGFLSGEITDYMDDKMGSSFMGELTARYRRISLNLFWAYGIISVPKAYSIADSDMERTYMSDETEDESWGLSIGVTVFDSRYVRVEPFLGISETDYVTADVVSDMEYLVGNNLDVRLLASTPKDLSSSSYVLSLRLKYMLQFGTAYDRVIYNGNKKTVNALRHTFGLGLGFEFW